MKILKSLFLSLAFISQVSVYASYAPYVETVKEVKRMSSEYGKVFTLEEIQPLVEESAKKYGVSSERMLYTIKAESRLKNIQSLCHKNEVTNCGNEGVREESYGVGQFNVSTLPKEQALDVYTAIDKMGYYFAKGEACRWTEYAKKYSCG